MKKTLLFLFAAAILTTAQVPKEKFSDELKISLNKVSDNTKVLVWIFFKDKGDDVSRVAPESVVSFKSLSRRSKVFDPYNLIDFTDLPVANKYIAQLEEIGFQVKHKTKWFNGVSGYVFKSKLAEISALPFVNKLDIVFQLKKKYQPVETNSQLSNNPTSNGPANIYAYNYGASLTQNQQINVPAVHDLGIKGQGVVICVMDAGFNRLSHESFAPMNIIAKWDFVNNDPDVGNGGMGEGSHGTQTLSTIGGFKEGKLIGPAFQSTYILAKTENTDSETPIEEDNWIAAAEWADSIGVDVTSTSLGYIDFDAPYTSYTWASMNGNTCKITIAADLLVKKGVVVLNSAGNEGFSTPGVNNTLGAPADGDSVISVGAVGSTGTRVSFSSYGPTVDGRIKPDVMAMGSGVSVASPYSNTGYTTSSGTSFSCPLAAGVAALILCKNPNLTPMQVRDAMRSTASRGSNPERLNGWGILNALNAINYFPVPVELVSFTGSARNGKVYLNWKTATEINNKGFEIQRKSGNGSFYSVGFVNGSGTSTSEKSYSFTDNNSVNGSAIYRLKQVDFDGTSEFSNEVTVNTMPDQYALFQNYPNPFNPGTTIRFAVPVDSKVKLSLYNVIGNEIMNLNEGNYSAGTHEYKLDGSQLSSGIYFVKMTAGNYQQTIKIALTK